MAPIAMAAIPAIGGIASGIGGLFSGKGGRGGGVDKNFVPGYQQTAHQLGQVGMPAYSGATDYWGSLLKGGNTAQQAVAPFAEQIRQVYSGTENNIKNTMPAGGERNLALAQVPLQRGNDIARLYAGVGPTAAGNLGQLGLAGLGLSGNMGGNLLNYASNAKQQKGSALGGLGAGLGSLAGGKAGGSSGLGKGSKSAGGDLLGTGNYGAGQGY